MPKPLNIIPSRIYKISIPETEAARLDMFLFSEAQGRVPQGSYREFLINAIREKLEYVTLDLSPYSGHPPGHFRVKGERTAIEILRRLLNGNHTDQS